MKKSIFLLSLTILCSLSYAQIKMNSSGYVTIGSTANATKPLDIRGYMVFNPAASAYYQIIFDRSGYYGSVCIHPYFNNGGDIGTSSTSFRVIYSNNFVTISDVRKKENVREMNNALEKILKLNAVYYDYKKEFMISDSIKDERIITKLEAERKNKAGFIAQDLQAILPEVVNYDDSTDIYGIDYTKIIPYLAEAIKEQQAIIDDLKSKIGKKSSDVIPNEKDGNMGIDEPYLEQNVPNPFSEATTINFFLPNDACDVLLNIYDMQGLQIKSYSITEKGNSSVIISSNELQPGMYLYTLIVDSKEIDTKRMILTN